MAIEPSSDHDRYAPVVNRVLSGDRDAEDLLASDFSPSGVAAYLKERLSILAVADVMPERHKNWAARLYGIVYPPEQPKRKPEPPEPPTVGYEDSDEKSRSVHTVSGGAFESNRRRH